MERRSITGVRQLPVDDVVAFDRGLSARVGVVDVFKTGFKNVNHEPLELHSSLECDGEGI